MSGKSQAAPEPGLIERTLLAIAPGFAAARAESRLRHQQHGLALENLRAYEAASGGRRNENWRRPATSAQAEVTSASAKLRNGARQLVRDTGHAASAINVLQANVVGTGISPGFETGDDAINARLKEAWEAHVSSEQSGAEDCGDFYSRQSLGFRSVVESGSVILRRRRRRPGRYPLPYQVQLLEPDFLDPGAALSRGRNTIINGKEFDTNGDCVAYHLFAAHPGDSHLKVLPRFSSSRILASEISHAYRMDRPGQPDGVSWFAPVMTTLRDLSDTRDAYQLRQKIAACYTAFIHDADLSGGPSGSTGSQAPVADIMEPGRVEALPPGRSVSFANPPGVDGLSDFDRAQLLTIAVGIGIPYEALTGDLKNVNFLSGRLGWLAFYRNIDLWRRNVVISKQCKPELVWFLQAMQMMGVISESQQLRVNWTAPHRDMIDPRIELKALREEMRLGLLSYGDAARMRGKDPDELLARWEKEFKDIEGRELYFDWMPNYFSLAGNANPLDGDDDDADETKKESEADA